jgi:hypothetical protein
MSPSPADEPIEPARLSVLQRASRAQLRYDPYVHLVVENCLPPDLYRALAAAYPEDETIVRHNKLFGQRPERPNQRNDIQAHRALADPSPVASIWQAFVRHHTSPAFWQEVVALLGPELRTTHPALERELGKPLEACRSSLRQGIGDSGAEISIDCQIGINTPSTQPSSVIGVHVDDPTEIVAMLLYFRREEDDSSGGDLEIHRWIHPWRRLFRNRNGVDREDAEKVATIPYRANTLVLFLNSLQALHSVSERSASACSRRLVNVILEVDGSLPQGLFPIDLKDPHQGRKNPRVERWRRRLRRLTGRS